MKRTFRYVVTLLLLLGFLLSNALPCGPGYITPLFDTTSAPESPFSDFAGGLLGIVKPEFRRSVLYAAYRWIAGNGMGASEQKAVVEVWNASINRKDFRDESIDDAVKVWVEKRKEIVGKEESTPSIYAERSYGGYDFFPNCTRNAFETATETLADRSGSHGPSDPNLKDWIKAQDEVFQNCANGKQTPDDPPPGAPEWLAKDRAYQKAAAEFYSLDYDAAKKHFAEIAQDSQSPWAETADYLVARTLIRQASLSKSKEKTAAYYQEAEDHLSRFVSRSGKFSASAERLMGLIKYRNHPRERVSELAKQLTIYAGSNENFRQDLIDYTWLLDKFENDVLTAEEKRKAAEKEKEQPANTVTGSSTITTSANRSQKPNEDDLSLYLYTDGQSYAIYVRPDATDADAIAAAEKVYGKPLTKEQKEAVAAQRQSAYAGRFTNERDSGYENYYGSETMSPSLIPDFLKQDELTDWLYNYQTSGAEAYLHALARYKQTGSDLWLMTALSKAEKSSTDLSRLIEAGRNAGSSSAAYPTIAYHTARVLLEQGKTAEARKIVDEMLDLGDRIPVSARNSFLAIKVGFAQTMDEYLASSLRTAYAFDFDGSVGTVDEFIAEQKTWYNPEYNKDGREAYEKEIEENYKSERQWQGRQMFDTAAMDTFNRAFPTASLIEVANSPALPEYLRERFVTAIWMRAFLLGDKPTLLKMTPELAKYQPDAADQLARITAAKTPAAFDNAVLFYVLKNPVMTPYLEEGMGKTDNDQGQWDSNDWWCEPYDLTYDDATSTQVPKAAPPRPPFLTPAQVQTAQSERKKLAAIGDAPKFLAEKVMSWAKRSRTDRRVPEALYIMIEANGWTKYGCGNNEELREEAAALLRRNYPNSEWTAKLDKEESEK